ncbi:hypothetical protein [Emticicia agri]|uniref:Uncharacterized protein n=1 Tax=Emticicia agri TaxID=2492393 RepID=A0A4Q5LZ58_9BACT|nr:hypothetical protein [Emticicia agri]RYU95246.1 hypothetical protein EWM59_12385 [Emticicia agri]
MNFDFLAYFSLVNPLLNYDSDENAQYFGPEFIEGINTYYEKKQGKFLNKENQVKKYNPDNWEIDETEGKWLRFTYYFDELETINDKGIADSFRFFISNVNSMFI